jgi:hypothetical protein
MHDDGAAHDAEITAARSIAMFHFTSHIAHVLCDFDDKKNANFDNVREDCNKHEK